MSWWPLGAIVAFCVAGTALCACHPDYHNDHSTTDSESAGYSAPDGAVVDSTPVGGCTLYKVRERDAYEGAVWSTICLGPPTRTTTSSAGYESSGKSGREVGATVDTVEMPIGPGPSGTVTVPRRGLDTP